MRYSHRKRRYSKNSDFSQPVVKNYDTEKYRKKYPEFFNEDFKIFCMTQVIPLYRKTKNKVMQDSKELRQKTTFYTIGLIAIGFFLLLLVPFFGYFLDEFFKYCILQFLPADAQPDTDIKIRFFSYMLVFLSFVFFIMLKHTLKIKMKFKEKRNHIIVLILAYIYFVGSFWFAISTDSDFEANTTFLPGLFPVILIGCYIFKKYGSIGQKLKKEYKSKMMQIKKIVFPVLFSKIAKCQYLTDEDKSYDLSPYLEKLLLLQKNGGMLENSLDDHFRIIYNDIKIEIAEITIKGGYSLYMAGVGKEKEIKRQKGGNCLFLRVRTNKPFSGKTLITRESSNVFKFDGYDFEKVYTEDLEFNQIFEVESTNQVDARYMLTPTFMEKLKRYVAEYKNNDLSISFEDGFINILLSVSFTDLFEIISYEEEVFASVDESMESVIANKEKNIDTYRGFLIEVKDLLIVIDALKLDSVIGL